MTFLSRLFEPTRAPAEAFAVPDGERLYAIGDIHGRRDLLADLLARIAADDADRGAASTSLVFLGDYVDRGPDSRGVVETLMALAPPATCLMGNHEEVLLLAATGDLAATRLFDRIGGRETLLSYGVDEDDYDAATIAALAALIPAAIPAAQLDWMRGLLPHHRAGGYVFVHAGLRPGIPLEDQVPADLRWIRGPFLDDPGDHGAMVIHGHSIARDVCARSNRIGIDTGAFATGRLTAIGLQRADRWFLQTDGAPV